MMRPLAPPEPVRELTGVVRLRRDLLAEGLTDQQVDRLVRAKVLHRIRYGAYVRTEIWDTCSPEDRHRLLSRAVLARAHDETALTHASSVIEQQIPTWGLSLDVVHTTREKPDRAGRRQRDWIPHRGLLAPDDLTVVNGVLVTKAPRAAFEVTTIAGVEASLVVVNRMLHSGAMTLAEFAAQVEEHQHWPGSLTADLVVRLADGRLESVGEDRFSYVAYRQGLPRPEPQYEVRDESGLLVGRVDFAWPERGVFLEFDGKVKYQTHRREGESLDDFLMREKKREETICLLTGWVCIRITWGDLARPELLATRIRKVMAARARAVG